MRIGIDLGGSKIEAVALDRLGAERIRLRIATPRNDYGAGVGAVAELVAEIEQKLTVTATVGVGMPGAISTESGLVKNANSTWLNGKPFQRDLEVALGREVRVQNDANCFALSEAVDGAAVGFPVVFGVIVGTGTGGGVVVNGHVLLGANAIAGEWGHNPLPWPRLETDAGAPLRGIEEWPGPPCYCGRSGCIETFLSGPGLSRDFAQMSGVSLDPAAIAARAERGDAAAEASLRRYEDRMARALASVINVLDPDVIVLGGGVSNLNRLYTNVPARWGRFVFSDSVRTRLVRARHGDASGVRGAARLWT
jgi:fructokinase